MAKAATKSSKESSAHHGLGGSVIKRRIHCPGSRDLEDKAGKQPASLAAAEGSVAHLIASDCLQNPGNPKFKPANRIGEVIEQDGFLIEVDEEMAESLMIYIRFARGVIKEHNLQPHHIFIEKRVWIPTRTKGEKLFGTTDFMAHIPLSHLHIGDLKYGKGVVVDVENNEQCLYYGVGGYFSLTPEQRELIDHVLLTIIQPRIESETNGISSFEAPKKRLKEFHEQILATVDACETPNAPLVADGTGEDWCKFCDAQAICPAFKAMLIDNIHSDFDDIKLPADVKKILPAPHDLSIEEIVRILNIVPAFNSYAAAMLQHAHGLAQSSPRREREFAALGWIMKKRRSNRRWRDSKMAEKILKDAIGELAYAKPKLLSPTQAEKVVERKNKKGADIEIDWKKIVEKPDNGFSLTRGKKEDAKSREQRVLSDFDDIDIDSLESAN